MCHCKILIFSSCSASEPKLPYRKHATSRCQFHVLWLPKFLSWLQFIPGTNTAEKVTPCMQHEVPILFMYIYWPFMNLSIWDFSDSFTATLHENLWKIIKAWTENSICLNCIWQVPEIIFVSTRSPQSGDDSGVLHSIKPDWPNLFPSLVIQMNVSDTDTNAVMRVSCLAYQNIMSIPAKEASFYYIIQMVS